MTRLMYRIGSYVESRVDAYMSGRCTIRILYGRGGHVHGFLYGVTTRIQLRSARFLT